MEEKRIIAIDFGSKRIGIAITDPLNMFAYPLITLINDSNFINKLEKIIGDYNVVKIILGLPNKEDGSESLTSKSVLSFKEQIEKKINIEIQLVDERYTSEIAKQRIIESVPSKKKRRDKSLLDKNAAAVMLEDYLRGIH